MLSFTLCPFAVGDLWFRGSGLKAVGTGVWDKGF